MIWTLLLIWILHEVGIITVVLHDTELFDLSDADGDEVDCRVTIKKEYFKKSTGEPANLFHQD